MLSPSLNQLYLSEIPSLVGLPSSFQNLHQLMHLEIKNCINLETLPTGINLKSLWELNLSGCSRLRTFPDISTNIGRLYLSETGIEEVPRWIEKLYWLRVLYLNGCINLEILPTGINLQSLYVLDLSGCSRLRDFPDLSINIKVIWMKGCNKLEYVNLNFSKLRRLEEVDFSDCLNLDKEALFQPTTYLGCQLWFSGEEVPSYFTHRTTGTSSSLTLPLLPSSVSQPFLRFRACLVLYDNYIANFRFRGRFWNSFDSFGQAQDFRADTEYYLIKPLVKGSHLLILDCDIPLIIDSDILHEMNYYTHVDLQLDFPSEYELKEWGIRLCSLAENQLGNPNTLPHVFETDEGSTLNEAGEGEEYGGNDVVTERSSKRMRIS